MKTLASNFTLGNKLLFVLNYEETIRLHEKTSIDVIVNMHRWHSKYKISQEKIKWVIPFHMYLFSFIHM